MDASLTPLTQYRSRLLSSGATYTLSAVPTLTREQLPVLNASNEAEFPDWHTYIRQLYGSRPPYPLDLSTLTWFYWFSPLRLSAIFLCDISDSLTEAPFGTPWTGGVDAWHWGPEHVVRRAGFFVHRPPWAASSYQQSPRIEVMRVGPIEQPGFSEGGIDALWFFHAIGSGIYVPTSVFSKLVVRYARRTSGRGLIAVPRIELVGHLPRTWPRAGPPPPPPRPAPHRRAAPLRKLTLGLQRSQPSVPDPARAARARSGACVAPPPYCASAEQFWPAMLRFELFDGRACESTAKQKRILSCANLPVPTWPGVDPMPHARKLRPRRPGKQAASLPLSLRLAVVAGAAAVVLYVAWAVYGLSSVD